MKNYADCCYFYKLFYCGFALIVACNIAGCSSTTTITRTSTEYIPPIFAAQKECIIKISGELKKCQGRVDLEQEECKGKALVTAQGKLANAQVDYQQNLAGFKEQIVEESNKQALQLQSQKKEYADCLARNKEQEAILQHNKQIGGNGQANTMHYFDTCSSPPFYGNNQAGVGGYAINPPEPQLEDFIRDAQCYASNECAGDYNSQYETCGGKVLTTTRCFANCAGDAK